MVRHRALLPARFLANACLTHSQQVASGSSIQGIEQKLSILSLSSGTSGAGCPEGARAHHTHAGLNAHHGGAFPPSEHARSSLPQSLLLRPSPLPLDPLLKISSSMQLQSQQQFSSNSSKPHSPALLDKVETALKPRLEQAFRLHATALWQQHRFKVYAVGSLFAVWVTWSLARSIASVFIDVCGLAAQWGLLGMAITLVAAAAQVLRWRFSINPAAVYRKAMIQLNSNPGVLEVRARGHAGVVGAGREVAAQLSEGYIQRATEEGSCMQTAT
uniref:Uncharacterized protein n=1 Tax=Dunaliella tertiolecta TaxID=3047 RepID=A0A7S3QZD6_DUNTE